MFFGPLFISLFGVMGLVIYTLPHAKIPLHSIRFFIPYDQEGPLVHSKIFSKQSIYRQAKGKKIVEVDLRYEFFEDYQSLVQAKHAFIVREMERMQFTNDTMSVLKIDFGPENSLGEFVWILNLAVYFNFHRYAFADESYYFFFKSKEYCQRQDAYIAFSSNIAHPIKSNRN